MAGKIALALFSPVFFVLLVEAALRTLNTGYPTSFLVPFTIEGEACWVNNAFYGYRFFPAKQARSPAPIVVKKEKPGDVVRIAVLGESAALGDPVIQFSAPRILERMLNFAETGTRFEVINLAMTAINSPVIADITRDLDKISPDVVILYIGNNEAVGPFGPGTVFGAGASALTTPMRITLSRLRLAHALSSVFNQTSSADLPGDEAFGMQLFMENRIAVDDSRLASMYRLYENRMRAIIERARSASATVLLNTMAVNLSDCGPFGSAEPDHLPVERQRLWRQAFRDGKQAQQQGQPAEALDHYIAAAGIYDGHAELAYRHAQVAAALGQHAEAARVFAKARDLDTQRFRTDSRLNQIIRDLGALEDITFVDAEQAFLDHGNDAGLFLDHVHFTFEGAYLLAGLWFDALAARHEGLIKPDLATVKERTFFIPASEARQAMVMAMRRTKLPFTQQVDNPRKHEEMKRLATARDEEMKNFPLQRWRELYKKNKQRDPDDPFFDRQFAAILMVMGTPEETLAVAMEDIRRRPHYLESRILPAFLLAKLGRTAEAADMVVGDGPPFGHYLYSNLDSIMSMLHQEKRKDEIEMLGRAILDKPIGFDGRDRLTRLMQRREKP